MIVAYTEMPDGTGSGPRPLLDVALDDMDELRFPCLVDSGASHTLMPRWLADAAGIDLGSGDRRTLAVARTATEAAFQTVRMTAGGHVWEANLAFCHP